MSSITEYGFERDNYLQILDSIKELFVSEFGEDVGLSDSDVFGVLAALLAKRQDRKHSLLMLMEPLD